MEKTRIRNVLEVCRKAKHVEVAIPLDDADDYKDVDVVSVSEHSGTVTAAGDFDAAVFLDALRHEGVAVPSFFTSADVFEHASRCRDTYVIRFALVQSKR